MNIKELEEQLGVSRANIRFYEKSGLLSPRRKENQYRDYNVEDIARLRKVIIFRKLGICIADIKDLFDEKVDLQKIIEKQSIELSEKIEELTGALKLCRQLKKEEVNIHSFNDEYYLSVIEKEESSGQSFVNIYKDYLNFESNIFNTMWKYVFFLNFKKLKHKVGLKRAWIILLIGCIIRGLSKQFLQKDGSFWEGFLYPFLIFAAASIILLPIFLLKDKHPKLTRILSGIIVIPGIIFLVGIILLLIIGFLNSWLHISNP